MTDKKNITGIILAGGKSSRMGSDKALLLYKGKVFLSHVINAIKPLVDDIIIVSNDERHSQFNYRRISDTIIDAGPLAGIHAGLTDSNTENNLVLSCDVPLIQTSILEFILSHNENQTDVIQIEEKGRKHPLIALYKKSTTAHINQALIQGERKLRRALIGLNIKTVSVPEGQGDALKNINTMMDLKKIENGNLY